MEKTIRFAIREGGRTVGARPGRRNPRLDQRAASPDRTRATIPPVGRTLDFSKPPNLRFAGRSGIPIRIPGPPSLGTNHSPRIGLDSLGLPRKYARPPTLGAVFWGGNSHRSVVQLVERRSPKPDVGGFESLLTCHRHRSQISANFPESSAVFPNSPPPALPARFLFQHDLLRNHVQKSRSISARSEANSKKPPGLGTPRKKDSRNTRNSSTPPSSSVSP